MVLSITTSLSFVILLWFGLASIVYIDTIVNLYCIVLMHKTNEIYYNKICKICHNKLYKCCKNYINKRRNKSDKNPKKSVEL